MAASDSRNYISNSGTLHLETLTEPVSEQITNVGAFGNSYEYHEVYIRHNQNSEFYTSDVIGWVFETLGTNGPDGSCTGEYRLKVGNSIIKGKFNNYSLSSQSSLSAESILTLNGGSSGILILWDDNDYDNVNITTIGPTDKITGYIRVNDVLVVSNASKVYVAGKVIDDEFGNIYAPIVEERYLSNDKIPIKLEISGNWPSQYSGGGVNVSGLTFKCAYANGYEEESVIPTSVYPEKWDDMPGNQTAYFSYIENGFKVSVSKTDYIQNTLSYLEMASNPNKMVYNHHETFNPSGAKVIAHWQENNALSDVTSSVIWNPAVFETVGQNIRVTASYEFNGITQTVSIDTITVNKLIDRIELESRPSKTTYKYGSNFNSTGASVRAYYSDGTNEIVPSNNIYWNPIVLNNHGNMTVTGAYSFNGVEKTVSVGIIVEKALERISITDQPDKLIYEQRERFDSTGSEITAFFSDGTNEVVDNSDVNWSPAVFFEVGNQEVTATYTYSYTDGTSDSRIDTLKVQVMKYLSYIEIDDSNVKKEYAQHSIFDPSGAIITAFYSDGSREDITSLVSWSPVNLDEVGILKKVEASYTYGSVTRTDWFFIRVYAVPVSLIIGNWTSAQKEGEAPSTSGLNIKCNYGDGSSKIISSASSSLTITPSVWAIGQGIQTATFSYYDEASGITVSGTKSANMTYNYSTQSDGHGSASNRGTYVYDASNTQTKTINYRPYSGYKYSYWSVSGGSNCSAEGNILTIGPGCRGDIVATCYFEADA